MLRYLRSALPAVVCLLIAASGASYALTAATEDPPAEVPVEETTPPEDGDTLTDPAPSDPAPTDPETPVDDPITAPVVDPAPEEGTGEETDLPEEESADEAKFSTEGCPEGFAGNHGQYVSSTDERPRTEAAKSPCGKPVKDDDDEGTDEGTDEGAKEGTDETTDEPDDHKNGKGKGKHASDDA